MATDIANGPQVATRLLKRSVYNAADMTFEQSLDEIASKRRYLIIMRMLGKESVRLKKKDSHSLMNG